MCSQRHTQLFPMVVVFCLAQLIAAQTTIHVPTDQSTIQGAIDAAGNGDIVLVAPGTYNENINFKGKAITVTSSGRASVTIIDGGNNGSVVTLTSGEGAGSILNGFTIQHGAAISNGLYFGGGIVIGSGSSPTITNNIIQNNTSCSGGFGIAVFFSSALIQNNSIVNNNNFHGSCSGADGAGIWVDGAGAVQIIGNLITDNAAFSGNGGGIALESAGNPTVKNNIIARNTATGLSPAAQGGGIYTEGTTNVVIIQNLIYNNAAGQGGGIFSGSWGVIEGNTIVTGPGAGSLGTAAYSISGPQLQFFNNVLFGSSGQNAVYCDGTFSQQPSTFLNNDAFSPSGTDFGGTCAGTAGQNGNISADPLFVNAAANDFHLQATSPAVDAGANSAPNLPQTDISRNPRILDGNNDCASTIDLGAYELQRAANVSFSATALTFGIQPLGTSSSPQSVTLSNTGNTCFQFSSLGTTGDFSQVNTCSAAGLPGGSSCVFNVTFTPTATGARNGALTVSGSDGITPRTPTVALSGFGGDFSITTTPTAATVKHGQSVKFGVTVKPVGTAFDATVALSCSGLPSGASCNFSPSSVTPGAGGATSVLTLSTLGKAPRGNYNVLIVGTSGSDSHSTTVLLSVI